MRDIEICKPLSFRSLLMAVVMTSFAMNAAQAAELQGKSIVTPKTESVVTTDVVTLGDIFDGVTENTGYILAPAPEPGKTKTLNANDLTRVSVAFNLGWSSQGGYEQVVLKRVANEIDRYAIEAALQEKLSQTLEGRKFDMQVSNRNLKIHLPPDLPVTVEVDSVSYDLAKGEFRAVLSAPSSENPVVKKEVRGRLSALTEVPVLTADLRAGDVITESDVTYIDVLAKEVTSSIVVSADNLVGMTPRRGIAAGKPITAADIEQPVVVKKGDPVTMTLQTGTMSLTAQGKSLESGAEGSRVRLLNISSNQVVEGIVTGPQSVDILSPSVTLASRI